MAASSFVCPIEETIQTIELLRGRALSFYFIEMIWPLIF